MDLGTLQDHRAGAMPLLHAQPAQAGGRLKLNRLRTPAQVATVLHLRGEIDLSVHAAAGPQFQHLEKKETSWASSWASSSTTS
jgi:hypothetical protein